MSKWPEHRTMKFIAEYKNSGCLWDVFSPLYKVKQARVAAYLKLSAIFCITTHEVKQKIKNLRSTYYQELKKIELSKKSGTGFVYIPSLIWFNEMDKLMKDLNATKKTQLNLHYMREDDSRQVYAVKEDPDAYVDNESETSTAAESTGKFNEDSVSVKEEGVDTQHTNKKRKTEEHEFDIFGKSVAAQLKRFSFLGGLRTQAKIQALLTEERIVDMCEQMHSPNFTNGRLYSGDV